MYQDRPGRLQHRRVGSTKQLISIYNDVDAMVGQFVLQYLVIGRRNNDKGYAPLELRIKVAKLEYLVRFFMLAVDEDAIGSGRNIRSRPGNCVVNALFQYQALDTCNNHEVIGYLGVLTSLDLFAETLDGVLELRYIIAEQGVLLQADLVFDDGS